jgi:hypothetical protein
MNCASQNLNGTLFGFRTSGLSTNTYGRFPADKHSKGYSIETREISNRATCKNSSPKTTTMFVPSILSYTLLSLLAATVIAGDDRPCGFKIAPCPTGQTCVRTDPACTRGENCAGICRSESATQTTVTATAPPRPTRTHQSCGGMRMEPMPCPEDQICIDDPESDGCGMACDMPGICVTTTFCGGYGNVKCKGGKKCVDDPRDDCDPNDGGYDCGGICV